MFWSYFFMLQIYTDLTSNLTYQPNFVLLFNEKLEWKKENQAQCGMCDVYMLTYVVLHLSMISLSAITHSSLFLSLAVCV